MFKLDCLDRARLLLRALDAAEMQRAMPLSLLRIETPTKRKNALEGAHLLLRALEAAEMRRAMPSSMLEVARGFCCASTSKAPRDMRTNSESRAHSAVVSWWPPVSAHTAPTASPLPTCVSFECVGASHPAEHSEALEMLQGSLRKSCAIKCTLL